MVLREPLTRRRRQQGDLFRLQGSKGPALLHAPVYYPDPLRLLGSGQIYGRLWRAPAGSMRDRLLGGFGFQRCFGFQGNGVDNCC
jgi:hypothetical protein